jgi:hypothetical protein
MLTEALTWLAPVVGAYEQGDLKMRVLEVTIPMLGFTSRTENDLAWRNWK